MDKISDDVSISLSFSDCLDISTALDDQIKEYRRLVEIEPKNAMLCNYMKKLENLKQKVDRAADEYIDYKGKVRPAFKAKKSAR